jgi:hypothetical protein
LKEFDSKAVDGRPLTLSASDSFNAWNDHDPSHLVVFLVDHRTGHVVAVAEQTMSR